MLDFDWGSIEGDVSQPAPVAVVAAPVTLDWIARPAVAARVYGAANGNRPATQASGERHPCEKCKGSGRYLGARVHQTESKCFKCGGKGWFKTSATDRAAARGKAADRKAQALADTLAGFNSENPGVAEFLRGAASWSPFCADLSAKLAQYGFLTDGQLRAVRSTQVKCAARQEAKAIERKAGSAVVDLSPIRAMFESAVASGYKAPKYRAEGLAISRAPDHGRNPGALYVKIIDAPEGEGYLGKIIGTQYSGKPAPALAVIAADPKGAAIAYGRRTGSCSCCGRELTKHASIELGIGPICAEKWNLA